MDAATSAAAPCTTVPSAILTLSALSTTRSESAPSRAHSIHTSLVHSSPAAHCTSRPAKSSSRHTPRWLPRQPAEATATIAAKNHKILITPNS
ncbi:MAG: hypothetical protein JFR41_05940 [Muribaculaceae bacterium]|nr:hypothetical protein [Muribaculaceae bacterium]